MEITAFNIGVVVAIIALGFVIRHAMFILYAFLQPPSQYKRMIEKKEEGVHAAKAAAKEGKKE